MGKVKDCQSPLIFVRFVICVKRNLSFSALRGKKI